MAILAAAGIKSVHIAAYQQLVLHHIEHRGFGGNIHSRGPGKERCFAVQGEEKLINVLIDRACRMDQLQLRLRHPQNCDRGKPGLGPAVAQSALFQDKRGCGEIRMPSGKGRGRIIYRPANRWPAAGSRQ